MQSVECKMDNDEQIMIAEYQAKYCGLSERFLDFGVQAIALVTEKLEKTSISKHIGLQFVRSVSSTGANYEEACSAESKADFIHKRK